MATQNEPNKLELSPRKVAERIKQEGKQKLEEGKSTAAEQVDSVASALKSAGSELDQNQPMLANYANQLADSVSRFSTRLREGSIEELISDAQAMARRNRSLFILGGVAAGVLLGRFVRASSPEDAFEAMDDDVEELEADAEDEDLEALDTSGESATSGRAEIPSGDSQPNPYSPNTAGPSGI